MSENLIERLVRYCNDIQSGNINACTKHIQAVNRFLNDIERSFTDEFPYELDVDTIDDFYNWSRMFKHSKGILAGKPVELTDFQLFIVANIFGWKEKSTGYARFHKSFIQIARKNAKSQLLSLIASYVAFLSGEKGEVYIAGWNKETSNIVYEEVLTQIKSCDLLKGTFSDSYHKITHLKSGSIIKALSRETSRFGDGLMPSWSIIDELHIHKDNSIVEVLQSGMISRANRHLCVITTAGFNPLTNPAYKEYQYVEKLLNPDNPVNNEEYFAIVCELEIDKGDNIQDQSTWIKANPIVCSYPEGIKALESELKEALDKPEMMRNVLTKNFNIWVEHKADGYLPLDRWRKCGDDELSLDQFEGMSAIVGVDLSSKLDLTSVSFLFIKDEILYVFSHSFMPEDTLEQKRKTDKVPYELWRDQGHITCTTGSVIDYKFVENYIIETEKKYGFKVDQICADPWNATQFLQELDQKGYTTVEIRQGYGTLARPTKDFRERVFAEKVKHDNNPTLAWAIGNAIAKMDANENIMLDKSKSSDRIDPIASVINAHVQSVILEGDAKDINALIMSDDFSF